MTTLMACGHTAQGTDSTGAPVCAICVGITEDARREATVEPGERMARCRDCKRLVPSSLNLPFFRLAAMPTCLQCGWGWTWHAEKADGTIRREYERAVCDNFIPVFVDSYYCGCRGWD